MKLIVTTCYSHLMYMQLRAEHYQKAVDSVSYTTPRFDFEGIAGYIETTITFQIKDLETFTKLYMGWYSSSNRDYYYRLVKTGITE